MQMGGAKSRGGAERGGAWQREETGRGRSARERGETSSGREALWGVRKESSAEQGRRKARREARAGGEETGRLLNGAQTPRMPSPRPL